MPIVGRALGAAMLFLALAAVSTMASVTDDWPIRSGLPGARASATRSQGFEQWRGRPLDVSVLWHPHRTWEDIRQANKSLLTGILRGKPGRYRWAWRCCPARTPASSPMRPWPLRRQLSHHRQQAGAVGTRQRDPSDRLGGRWRSLGRWHQGRRLSLGDPGRRRHASAASVTSSRSARGVARLRHRMDDEEGQRAGERSLDRGRVAGRQVCDLVGIDYYDGYPARQDSAWNADFKSLEHKGPRGLGAWLDFAKRHHKKLAIPEWGVRNKPKVAGDDPRYIQPVFGSFATMQVRSPTRRISTRTARRPRSSPSIRRS